MDIVERAPCVECRDVVSEHYGKSVEGRWLCNLCAEKLCTEPAHPADCGCRVCDAKRIGAKHEQRVSEFLTMRPMRRWPAGGIR